MRAIVTGRPPEALEIARRAIDYDPYVNSLWPDRAERHRAIDELVTLATAPRQTEWLHAGSNDGALGVCAYRRVDGRQEQPEALLRGSLRWLITHPRDALRLRALARMHRLCAEASPTRARYELALLAVAPDQQDLGLGGSLLRAVIERVSGEGLPWRAVVGSPLALRALAPEGFTVARAHRVNGSPPVWTLVRPARRRGSVG